MNGGIVIVNKPSGMTSHDIVDAVRRITRERCVGHAGTLDPLATGVLVIGIGREATKALGFISGKTEKKYAAVVLLGATSDTDDREGRIVERDEVEQSKKADVQKALNGFVGTFEQMPPVYSAIKVGGVKSYEAARKGKSVALEPRRITIHSIDLRKYAWPLVTFDVTCSSGTYIRALARDLGEKLGTGGLLQALERTAVGSYTLAMAHTLEELKNGTTSHLLPIPNLR